MDENKIRKLYAQNEVQQVFTNLQSSSSGLSDEEAAKRLKNMVLILLKKPQLNQNVSKTFLV
ncbi:MULTISPECIES: cation-transporting P-type ATPase [unclassified Lactobacillus]|uniref:cation-transporting P-type ATPase n=1 Tax=unclassified Lactobacillus TaxID=2620435 RepID=UPI000BEEAC5A|nr:MULTISPECIES: cation-transporting P-type ATPase [unclassified Lactobacillus]PEG87264.1 hypothetical protein CP365_03315 [Lactobacillus sp. UMNPBX14]PEH02813.1 hypothetical protein CP357_03315 [Lactobacillus sp. UMNPBX6]